MASVALPVNVCTVIAAAAKANQSNGDLFLVLWVYGGAAFVVKRWIFYFLCLVSWLENLGGAVVLFTCFS